MSTELRIQPENLEVANLYLETNSIEQTASYFGLDVEYVQGILNKKEVQGYINQVYLDTGYRNKFKIGKLLDKMIEEKLLEAEETGFYTKYDMLDLLKFAHNIRIDENKQPQQTNIQINNEFGDGKYGELMKKLVGDG